MARAKTVQTSTDLTTVLSERVFAILTEHNHNLNVIIELGSMLEEVNDLMREEIFQQLDELKDENNQRDRVEKGPIQQAVMRAMERPGGSVLRSARASTHIAVCKMMFSQEWPYVEAPEVEKRLGYVPPKKPSPEFLAPPASPSAQEEMVQSLLYAVGEVIEELKVVVDRKQEQIAVDNARKQQELEASIARKQKESEMISARGERLRRRNGDAATTATTSGAGGVVDNVAGQAADPATPKLKIKIKPASNAGSSSSTSESGQAVRPSTPKLKIKIKPASNASASKSVSPSSSSQGATKTVAVNAKKTPAASEAETMSSSAMRASYGQPSFKLKIKPFPTTGISSSASKDTSSIISGTNATLAGGPRGKMASTTSRSKIQPSSALASSSSSVASKPVNGTKRKASEELDKPKRKRTAAAGPQQSWTAKEEMAVIPLWWKPDLDVDEKKRKGHGTAARVLKHAEWIKAQGGVWTRSWEALDQHVRTLRQAGEDMASVKTRYDAEVRETGGQ
ncbi:hypothetical protein LTR15_009762 [Elasticomyces elasticus]|nr:hypothetical protein LTR15_009762 [Elasticomyces elasticus]